MDAPSKKSSSLLKRTLFSLVLSFSSLVNAGIAGEKPIEKPDLIKEPIVNSVAKTTGDYLFFFSHLFQYSDEYDYNFNKEFQRKAKNLNNLEKVMLIGSISNSYPIERGREPQIEDYDRIRDFIKDVGESAFRRTFDEAFKESGLEIEIGDSDEQEYRADGSSASMSFGGRPSVRGLDEINLRGYAKIKNLNLPFLQFSSGRFEVGTDVSKVRLIAPLEDGWFANLSYSYEYSEKQGDLSLSLVRQLGENARVTLTTGYGRSLLDEQEKDGFYFTLNAIGRF